MGRQGQSRRLCLQHQLPFITMSNMLAWHRKQTHCCASLPTISTLAQQQLGLVHSVWCCVLTYSHAAGQYIESLDAVLKHDSRRISKLISCIGYTSNSSVQLEAIKLTQVFAARQPHLVEMLVQQRVKVTADGKHGTLFCHVLVLSPQALPAHTLVFPTPVSLLLYPVEFLTFPMPASCMTFKKSSTAFAGVADAQSPLSPLT